MTHDRTKTQTLVSHLVKAATCIPNGFVLDRAVEALELLMSEDEESSQFQLGQRVRDKRNNERFGTVISLMGTHYEEDCLEVWFDDCDNFETTLKVYVQAIPENYQILITDVGT